MKTATRAREPRDVRRETGRVNGLIRQNAPRSEVLKAQHELAYARLAKLAWEQREELRRLEAIEDELRELS